MVQDLGVLKLKSGPSLKLKSGPSFFTVFPHVYSVFWAFLETQIVQQCVKIVFCKIWGMSKMRFSKRKLHFLFFPVYVGKIETEKRKKMKMEKTKNTSKNRFF